MTQDKYKRITGLIGVVFMVVFIFGLAHGISSGFAGFWGGFPFWVISILVLLMAAYDYWDECLRKRPETNGNGNGDG